MNDDTRGIFYTQKFLLGFVWDGYFDGVLCISLSNKKFSVFSVFLVLQQLHVNITLRSLRAPRISRAPTSSSGC